MGRFLSSCSHVLTMIVHVQISIALFLNKCPEKLMWTIRAKQLCGVEDKYMCLYDTNVRSFRELCKESPEFHRPGNVFVISGNLQYFAGKQCNSSRYQPHKWWTNGSSDCQYLKSTCNGEGQIPYDNGTITKDRKCRCDYTNYFTFGSSTINKCHCDPIVEDCSCYSKRCYENQVLTPDYDCVGIHEWTGRFICPEYRPPKFTNDKQGATLCPISQKDDYSTIKRLYVRIAVSLLTGILAILGLIAITFERLRKILQDDFKTYVFEDYFLEDPSDIYCMEGEDAIVTCKIDSNSPSAIWLNDSNEIMVNNKDCIMSTVTEKLKRVLQLTLKNTKASDSGEYCVKVGKYYRKLQIKIIDFFFEDPSNIDCMEGNDALFTCKVRHKSPPPKWLKDNKEIVQNENYNTLHDKYTEYELLLKNVQLSNNGEYCVKVGKYSRKLKLNIKSFFLEEPANVECIKGRDAILSCKVGFENLRVKWLKYDNEIMQNDKYTISNVLKQKELRLQLKNTTTSDSGEYCVKVGKFSRKIQLKINEIPSDVERNIYMEAIKTGKEVRQYVRINVVGKDRVGKSSLVRRLLGQTIEDVTSTDGIDINRTCQIRKSDGEWIVGKVNTEKQKFVGRILQTINKTHEEHLSDQRSKSEDTVFEAHKTQNDQTQNQLDDHVSLAEKNENKSLPAMESKLKHRDIKSPEQPTDTSHNQNPVILEKMDTILEKMGQQMDDLLVYAKNNNEMIESEGLVDCDIWDFAGEKDYYITHQAFFTRSAIYILVANILDDIQVHKYDDLMNFSTNGEYFDFWLDSIHCFCDAIQESNSEMLSPPVIIVCTGIDKIADKEAAIKEYKKKFLDIFGCQKKSGHIRVVHFISNTISPEQDFEHLKKDISEIAKEMQYFSEDLPSKCIQLENALELLRDLNECCVKWENIEKLARKISMEKDELLRFLNYQHTIGKIIFFEDKRDYIVLQPNWLVDCFKCLVCDSNKYFGATQRELYDLKLLGKLSDSLIDKLYQKNPRLQFGCYKKHILDVMEKFNIIIKQESSTNQYYMPSMIERSSTLKDIKNTFKVGDDDCTPWVVFEFEFLPISYFNHFLFSYIRRYVICKTKEGQPALYAGKAVLRLDSTGCRLLTICFSKNALSLQIWSNSASNIDDDIYERILKDLCIIIDELERTSKVSLHYEIKAKCSSGDYSTSSDRLSYEQLTQQHEYCCREHHDCNPSKKVLVTTWLKHVPKIKQEIVKRKNTLAEKE